MNRNEKLIYMAGFFDGEGCIHLSRQRSGKSGGSLNVIVVQKEREPLDVFLELWPQARMRMTHRRQVQHHGTKAYFQVQLNGQAGAEALLEMLPYLMVKRSQAKLAIDYQDAVNAWKGNQPSKHWTPEMSEYRNIMAQQISDLKRAGATTESFDSE